MAVYLGSNRVLVRGGTVNTGGSVINNQNKTVTPTTAQQTITADSGYTGLGTVTVNRIPTNYIVPSGTLSITTNGTKDVTAYASVNVNVPTGSTINNQNKTVSPTESSQSISADSGYTGLGTVTVNAISKTYVGSEVTRQAAKTVTPSTSSQTAVASGVYTTGAVTVAAIPSTYIVPSGNKNITANGTNIDVKAYATVSVAVPSSGTTINNQDKTVNPSTSKQTITADSGYTGLGTVTVNAMSTMTLPTAAASSATSGYSSKATIGRSTSTQYINIPPGYNGAGAYYVISAVPNGSVTAPSSISGSSATVTTGTNTLTLTKTVSVTPNVTTAGYVSSGTAGNASVSLTASVTTKAAATITPGTSNQTIAAGTYLTGTQTIVGDADLKGSNILSTANIFGVQGTVELTTVYVSTSAPGSSTGSNGDIYIQK